MFPDNHDRSCSLLCGPNFLFHVSKAAAPSGGGATTEGNSAFAWKDSTGSCNLWRGGLSPSQWPPRPKPPSKSATARQLFPAEGSSAGPAAAEKFCGGSSKHWEPAGFPLWMPYAWHVRSVGAHSHACSVCREVEVGRQAAHDCEALRDCRVRPVAMIWGRKASLIFLIFTLAAGEVGIHFYPV